VDSSRITDLLAHSIAATITDEIGIPASIKPPNDVYASGRKVAGVLVEMKVEPGGNYCAIAGLGVNVNHTLEDFPAELRETAASLAMVAGHSIDRPKLAAALLRNIDARYAAW
jgi:BirA family biotin operon repressor/biotin-[acetyl-CoA-carboxylase] ligase